MIPQSLFPDEFPPPPVKAKPVYRPSPKAKDVLAELRRAGPLDEWDLHRRMIGSINKGQISTALDALAKAGLVHDTGERGRWTTKGRAIVWALSKPDRKVVTG